MLLICRLEGVGTGAALPRTGGMGASDGGALTVGDPGVAAAVACEAALWLALGLALASVPPLE